MWKVKNETSKLPPQFKMKTLTASGNHCMDVFSTLNFYYKETHTELPNETQSLPQKQNENQPTRHHRNIHHLRPLHKSSKLQCTCSETFSPFKGQSIRVQYFFFSSTLQYRKCYWWTAPKICVFCQKIIKRTYELLLCQIISLTTENKSRTVFLITKIIMQYITVLFASIQNSGYQLPFLSFLANRYIPLPPLANLCPFGLFGTGQIFFRKNNLF